MHSVWAVARNTIAQALRMEVALVVIVMLLILIPLLSATVVGDMTLLGKLQTFVSIANNSGSCFLSSDFVNG